MSESKQKAQPKPSHTSKIIKNMLKQKPKPGSAVQRVIVDPRKIYIPNRRDNKPKELNVKRDKKNHLSKSSQKTRPNNNHNLKQKIYMSKSNKNFIHNIRSNLSVYNNTEKNEMKNNNKKVTKSKSNAKIKINRDTIGQKMIREEIAKEKKMCTEKIKIIKAHILSLQKKEEELEKKVMILNNRENALGNLNIEKEEYNDNEKKHNYSERKIYENKKDKIKEKEKDLDKEKITNNSEKKSLEKENDIDSKDSEHKMNNENEKNKENDEKKNITTVKKEDEKDNEKERKSNNKTDIDKEKKKLKGKNEKNKNIKNMKLTKKREKTPEKKMANNVLANTSNNNNSNTKVFQPKKHLKTNSSVENKKNVKPKEIKNSKK